MNAEYWGHGGAEDDPSDHGRHVTWPPPADVALPCEL